MVRSDNLFRWFDSSPEVIRTVVMMYVRFPLSLRQVEDLLAERGIDIWHETVRHWWNRFDPMFAGEIRCKRVQVMRSFTHWRWHLDEVVVRINGARHYLWRAVDHEGEILKSFVTRTGDKASELKFLKKAMRPSWPSGRRSPSEGRRAGGLRSAEASPRLTDSTEAIDDLGQFSTYG